jgi:carbon monoxide dehydrogenase subunit G
MRLEHRFEVPAKVDEAWAVLLDVPRIAPCLPGAALTEHDGESFAGTVKVRVGPITLTYRGTGHFVERDDAAHRVVIEASGRESRGSGTAGATITATLTADGPDTTSAEVAIDLTVTGRPAQFGRGMLAEVSSRLVDQFAAALAKELATDHQPDAGPAEADPASEEAAPGGGPPPVREPAGPGARVAVDRIEEVEPIDLLHVSGIDLVVRRVAPYLAVAVAGGLVGWLLGRRRRP